MYDSEPQPPPLARAFRYRLSLCRISSSSFCCNIKTNININTNIINNKRLLLPLRLLRW